ncbi:MAG: COG4315 family predicted lipoprotein [Solirubrobacterales bacterium]
MPIAVAVAAVIVFSACGDSGPQALAEKAPAGSTGATGPTAPAKKRTGKTIKTGKTDYGRILQDGRGHTIYLFTEEHGKTPRCYRACAKAWPPVLTKGDPVADGAAKQSKLGTTRRKGGKIQVTYNGHPLYYYVEEDEANEVLCQAAYEFGGYWYILGANGRAKK